MWCLTVDTFYGRAEPSLVFFILYVGLALVHTSYQDTHARVAVIQVGTHHRLAGCSNMQCSGGSASVERHDGNGIKNRQ